MLAEYLRSNIVRRADRRERQLPVTYVLSTLVDLIATHIGVSLLNSGALFLEVSQVVTHQFIHISTLWLDLNMFAQTKVTQLDVTVLAND